MKNLNRVKTISRFLGFYILTLLFMMSFSTSVNAQIPRYYQNSPKNNEGKILTVNILFGGHTSGGDLGNRFGSFMSTGLGLDYITSNNFILGAQGTFNFGSNVKEDVIAGVRSEDGLIFGDQGGIAEIQLRQRGINAGIHIGKLIRLSEDSRSGIRITLGGGFSQHKIRIQDDPQVFVSQLNKDYKKGYDRLTNGVGLTEFIGYQHFGKYRRINFFFGFELNQAFTKNRRSFNFDAQEQDTESRFDLSYGIRAGWKLPFYLGEEAAEIRY